MVATSWVWTFKAATHAATATDDLTAIASQPNSTIPSTRSSDRLSLYHPHTSFATSPAPQKFKYSFAKGSHYAAYRLQPTCSRKSIRGARLLTTFSLDVVLKETHQVTALAGW